jgi:hypothetical protein
MAQNSHETGGASRVVGKTEPPEPNSKVSPVLPVIQGVMQDNDLGKDFG